MMMAESGIELRLTEIEGVWERNNALQFAITGEKEKERKNKNEEKNFKKSVINKPNASSKASSWGNVTFCFITEN